MNDFHTLSEGKLVSKPFNAVIRLQDVLSKLAEQPNSSIGVALTQTLGYTDNNNGTKHVVYSELVQLSEQAVREAQSLKNAPESLYVKPLEAVESTLQQLSALHSVKQLIEQIGSTNMTHLQHCAYATGNFATENKIGQGEIDILLKDVHELLLEIATAELPARLREFIIEQLQEIERALVYYQISGVKGLKKAIERIIGATVNNQELIKHESKSDSEESQKQTESFFARLGTIANKIAILVTLAQGGQEYLLPAIPLLIDTMSSLIK